jgi:predicted phosphodiesterase
MSRVLVFGDTHIPFMRKGYVEFLKSVYKKYRCDKVVCVGDLDEEDEGVDDERVQWAKQQENGEQ